MASYFSSLLTTTTSRVATLRANLLPNEHDGDTPDDTHLCRVLRAYYTEKGRPFPSWLPPDPKAPPPTIVQPVLYTPTVGSSYGGLNQNTNASGSALSSLWDSQPQSGPASPQGRVASPSSGSRSRSAAARQNPFSRQQQRVDNSDAPILARPLPSQRAGSYQSAVGRDDAASASSSGSGQYTSAKDRLRRLAQPRKEVSRTNSAQASETNSYNSATSGGSNYEDRFAPPDNGSGRLRSGGRSGATERPFVAATSPWASTESEFGGGGYSSSQSGNGNGRQGLPSGPASGRRGYGTPNGPRAYR